ncbi:MAG: NAD(P)H-binding protein [Chloroflexi bacterium]|nr:NAD(P)H-binding protein [Chloroflexota bacterium]
MEREKANAPILVLGGTGHYGRNIVKSLLAKGQPVRVLSRNAANAREVLGDEAEIVEGDITSRESVVEALEGVKAGVIAVAAFTPKLIRKLKLIEQDSVLMALEEARKMGVSRIVYISVYDIREDWLKKLRIDFESARIKQAVETYLARSDFNWTVLGAPPTMEIFFTMIRGNTMIVPGGGPPALPTVSPVDVGEIAAQTVLRDDLQGKRIRMTGPEALSFPEAAKRISAVTGKKIKFRKMPLLPLKIVSIITWPVNPYLRHLVMSAKLMNNFPQDMAVQVPQDHQWLVDTFSYTPTTLEMEARKWAQMQ